VSPRVRIAFFVASAAGFAALLAWGVSGLHAFGGYDAAYGTVLNRVEPKERHADNVVMAIVFDYRGFDTMGEELILFGAVMGTALLLRGSRARDADDVVDRAQSEALRAAGVVAVPVVVLLALDVISHGLLTPGGGFQGGVVAAAGLLLVYLAGEFRALRRAAPKPFVDSAEAAGAAGYVVVGLAALIVGDAFLQNFLPLGTLGLLTSGGTISVINWCVGLEVTAAFVLLFVEFLEEVMTE
jgi:multicomponent Na+:H+ antiporter subunit B